MALKEEKKPLTTVESIVKYMKNHEVIYITAKTLDNTPVPKNIREELDKMTNNFLETNSFKEIRKFIKEHENTSVLIITHYPKRISIWLRT